MSNEDEHAPSPDSTPLQALNEQALAALGLYSKHVHNGTVPDQVQEQLREVALSYYYALYEYRDEGALDEPWEERGIDWLDEYNETTVVVDDPVPRANGATSKAEKPALMAIPASRLKDALLELNDIYKELGFAPRAKDVTPHDEGDLADLETLLQRRGQTESAEALPDGGGA